MKILILYERIHWMGSDRITNNSDWQDGINAFRANALKQLEYLDEIL